MLVADLRAKARVVLADEVTDASTGRLYLVVGPDRPFTPREASILARLVRSGRLNLVVADETNNTRPLLEALGLPPLDGIVHNASAAGGGWDLVVHMRCGPVEGPSAKSASVDPSGGEPVCQYAETGDAAAALYRVGGGLVLVVGDSSVFANYLYGGYTPLGSTRDLAWYLLSLVLDGRSPVVVDNSHYTYSVSRVVGPSRVIARVVEQAAESLGGISSRASEASPAWLLLGVAASVLPWPLILLYPGKRGEQLREPLDGIEELVLEMELSRAGLPLEISPERALEELGVEDG